jgi:thioester reductase-like protein/short-subunit dehydrogenase
MSYFVTGGTGFIGRFLIERLLKERTGQIHVLVRAGSLERLEAMIDSWPGGAKRVKPVVGDLTEPLLGVDPAWITKHKGKIDHYFHLAAIYDMTASDAFNQAINVEGTQHAIALADALKVGCLHHTSSVAAAGDYEGTFLESMFDEGQPLPSPYHRTKFESEALVRETAKVPWRVYRPAVVVGHSETGEMDKIDGPYYLFKAVQRMGATLPGWAPLVGPELGRTNIVPVDFVVNAMDHIAHTPGLDRQAFHLVHPDGQPTVEVFNALAKCAGAPQIRASVGGPVKKLLPAAGTALDSPGLRQARDAMLQQVGIPPEILGHVDFTCRFDDTGTRAALAGSGIEAPDFASYAPMLWSYWEQYLDPKPRLNRAFAKEIKGKTVVITGASSGIGKETAIKVARAGGIPILIARTLSKLETERDSIIRSGGEAYAYSCDLSDLEAIDELVEVLLENHPRIDVLVNNAGRSIRRSIALSGDRFHDFERTMVLNYFGAIRLTMGLMPHMRAHGGGHVTNISSIGVQTAPPRFSAYIASKAALDAWTRVVSSEVIGDNITFTTIHMPLVRTPMIAPTKIYDYFPTTSPSDAADWICASIVDKPKHINTTIGTIGEVSYALVPKMVDQVLHAAYRVFPDSAAARGSAETPGGEKASMEQIAMANVVRGVHW